MVAIGSGVLVPFWVVELPYTFETGVLWTKRGKEVPELLLVSATFPTDLSSFGAAGVSRPLTDVFSSARIGGSLNQLYGRISGKEERITSSGSLRSALQNVAVASVRGQPAVPPLTTAAEALKVVRTYVSAIHIANPGSAAQLRASSPRVVDFLYLPCDLHGPVPLPWLGALSPASLGDSRILVDLAR